MIHLFYCPNCGSSNFTRYPGAKVRCQSCWERVRSPESSAYRSPADSIDLFLKVSIDSKARRWPHLSAEKKVKALSRMTSTDHLPLLLRILDTERLRLQWRFLLALRDGDPVSHRTLEQLVYKDDLMLEEGGAEDELKQVRNRLNRRLVDEGWPFMIRSRKKQYFLTSTSR
jgi:hypothetical protein